jgi:hypothetical protein
MKLTALAILVPILLALKPFTQLQRLRKWLSHEMEQGETVSFFVTKN